MKLSDFPLLMAGFKEIELDQHRRGAFIKEDETVHEWERHMFTAAEYGLEKLKGKTLGDILPATVYEMPGYEDLKDPVSWNESAFYWFCLPVNDLDEFIADYSGMKPSEYWWAKKLFEEFFDGDLRERFQGLRN